MKLIVGKNDLATTHPELAKQAEGWDPRTVFAGTHKKLMWKCDVGHDWLAEGYSRVSGNGCPVCANRKVLTGFNDLATTHPELAMQAEGWDPTKVIAGTHKKFMWKCKSGHVWMGSGESRINGGGCPVCANKKVLTGFNDLATTHPELAKQAVGWDPTKVIAGTNKKLQWKCDEGHIWSTLIGERKQGYGCPVCVNRTVLTGFNDLATKYPELAKQAEGWDPTKVIAGTNKKLQWKCDAGHVWFATGEKRINGRGCPVCANNKVLTGFNDLATTHPELAKQAEGWDPTKVFAGTNKKLQWKCDAGHIWLANSNGRRQGNNCPFCGNQKLLKDFNDLATTHPELAMQAEGWDPTKVIAGTHKKLKWKCNLGHVWLAAGDKRIGGGGCPSCAKTGFDPNQNGFIYFLIQPNWEIYQIGITNVPEDRLNRHSKNGFELLELRGPMDGHTAQELETAMLRYLKSKKADLSPEHVAGKFDGYTESWTMDSYKVNNLKELIDKASEAGF